MQIHQFVHTLNYGDAISGEAIAISRLLCTSGVPSHIYTVHSHEKVRTSARPCECFEEDVRPCFEAGERVGVILHYSIASPLNDCFRELRGIGRVMIYHNLTPVRWFSAYNARVAEDVRKGRDELPKLMQCADIVLADSEFNQQELRELGRESVEVLPLLLDKEKWAVSANRGITSVLRGHGGVNVLHVGRLAPNKCIEDIIKAFYFFHHKIEPKSRLWLIGGDVDTEIYSFELRSLVSELRLKDAVTFVGSVADSELRAFYENSDMYLCMSEHEGFCVPMLEAMYFGLPIIAFNACAVKGTLGDAGLLLQRKSPAEVAELMDILMHDNELRAELIERGKARVESFGEESFAQAFRTKVTDRIADKQG